MREAALIMARMPEKIIDFHVHLFPDKLFDAIWKSFLKHYHWNIIHQYYYQECIERLRQAGVGVMVYSNYAHRAGIAEGLNAWNIKILQEYDDLYCFAAYHPDDEHALDMARRLLEIPGFSDSSSSSLFRIFIRSTKGSSPSTSWSSERTSTCCFTPAQVP